MVKVKVKSVLNMAKILGANELFIELQDGASVADAINFLREKYGTEFIEAIEFKKHCESNNMEWKVRLLHNGINIKDSELTKTVCSDGDIICLLTPLAGG